MTRLTPDELAAVRMERELLLAELRRLDAMISSQPERTNDAEQTVRMLLPGVTPLPPRPPAPGMSLRAAAAIADLIDSDRTLRDLDDDPDSVTGDETADCDACGHPRAAHSDDGRFCGYAAGNIDCGCPGYVFDGTLA